MAAVGELREHAFVMRGYATIILKDPSGKVKRCETVPNVLKHKMFDVIASALAGSTIGTAIYLGLAGTNAEAGALGGPTGSDDDTISGEAVGDFTFSSGAGAIWRLTGSYTIAAGAQSWTVSATWAGADSALSKYYYYVGLCACQSVGGTPILAAASFAVVSKASQDSLTVAWTFCISNSVS